MSRDRIIQLQECAEELGFSTIQDALDAGYVEGYDLVGNKARLVKPLDFSKALEEQEKAHEAWLEERDALLKDLREQEQMARESYEVDHTVIKHAIDFIEKGEM